MINNNLINVLSAHKDRSNENREWNISTKDTEKNKEKFNSLLSENSKKINQPKENDKHKYSSSLDSKDDLNRTSQEKSKFKKLPNLQENNELHKNEDESNIESMSQNIHADLGKVLTLLNQIENNDGDFKHEISEVINLIDKLISSEVEGIPLSPKELSSLNSVAELLSLLENNSIDFKEFISELNIALDSIKLSIKNELTNHELYSPIPKENIQNKETSNPSITNKVEINNSSIQSNEVNSESQVKVIKSDEETKSFDDDSNLSKENSEEKTKPLYFDLKENNPEARKPEGINSSVINHFSNTENIQIEDLRNFTSRSIEPEQIPNNLKTTVLNQIVEGFKLTLNNDSSEILIKLKPDNLGDLTMKLVVERGIVIARFDVESQIVKQTIETNLEDLKNSLNDKGFQIQEFNVSVNKDSKKRHDLFNFNQKNKGNKKTSRIGDSVQYGYENNNYMGSHRSLDGLDSTINYLA